ncbi:hypothetical protein HU200_009492 [Digitaria exilis]|uniref:Uncharacterized protein n=1 Tax=Digitaria exilis TaxID=1010633 RepID=A0A835FL43_9POAL|nr:hypothetical protein HU200_009492 [Digitaria exilis]
MEMVAAPVVQRVAGKLGDIAWEKLQLLWNFKEDVQDIEGKMVDLQVTLSSADKHSRGTEDSPVQHWLKKYKFVAYDMEDALDELEADAMIWKHSPSKVKMFFSSINPLVVRITMSNKIRNIRVKLDKISEDQKKFTPLLLPTPTGQDNNKGQGETFIGERDEIEMVGREKEKNDILIKVSQKEGDQEISIIPVVGLGGMGKTTLAKSVYNDKQTLINFDVKAWVHVSEDFDLNKIVSDIICQVEGASPGNNVRLQYLKSRLDHILIDKIYLIVLDDLWEEGRSNLKDLMEMLQSGKKGSNVIVTTRNEKVASTLSNIHSSIFRTADPIKLEGMSIDECWSIMKPHNLGNAQLTELEDIGKEIAQLCHGVPLVAKALGYVMQKHCTRKEWLGIKNSNILDIKDGQKGILKGLLLSYYHMPPELKLCFMYCSMFPKGHDIDHDCLIQQWIALGFIQGTEEHLLQKIGTEYINELLGMSFLSILTSSTVSPTRIFKPTLRLRMHDMVHDLARHVAADEFSYTTSPTNIIAKRDMLNCHYYLLINQNEASSTYKSFPTKVRSLHSRGCDKMHLPKQAFSNTLCLRVLDLSGCHVKELASSIYKLKLLRYLDGSNLPISSLHKSLNRLLNLQTLILANTSLMILPTDIGLLQKLQYFDLSGCSNLHELPPSFGDLSTLLFLNLASCHELHKLPESFGKLCRLQFLNLSDCYKLHSLPESCCQLHDLIHLDLSDCHNLEKLPDCVDQLSKLEYLNMTSCSKVQMLPESICKLTMLKHLDLSFCVKLEYLPSSFGDLRLQRLDLEGCFFLGDLPDGIFSMSTLVHVETTFFTIPIYSKLNKLREKLNMKSPSRLHGGSGDLWSRIAEIEKTPCYELGIEGLESVKNLEGAEQAKLSNNSYLTRLIIGWDHPDFSEVGHAADATADKVVLEKLTPPRGLELLGLSGYMSMDLPKWMLDVSSYLPHLTMITLNGLVRCNHLPPLGRLPNLRALFLKGMPNIKSVGWEFYGDYGSCQKLRIIILDSMNSLEEWWTTRSSHEDGDFLIPNLHLLATKDCPKLKFLPYPPRSVSWLVVNSDHVLPEHGFGNLSSTTSPFFLAIEGASLSSEVWRRIHYLSSIEGLVLSTITGLRTLPEAIRCFRFLRKLVIECCEDLETLPEWLEDLSSLREILINYCQKLSSLPESIVRLTELKKLRIINCPDLSEKCRGEDKHKIAHIPEVEIE